MGKIVGMNIKNLNKENNSVKEMIIETRMGIIGDIHAGKSSMRQISLLRVEVVDEIHSYDGKGLCTKRFIPNMIIEGLDLSDVTEGAQFIIGDAVIKISQVGKSCFHNCQLVKERSMCPLSEEALFAKVIESGTIAIEDEVRKIK